jgi:hypothetical protein
MYENERAAGRIPSILWHPHQGLWNWDLTALVNSTFRAKPFAQATIWTIIFVDSVLLWARALGRRLKFVGLSGFWPSQKTPQEFQVIYLDLGLHTGARELLLMANEILPEFCANFAAFGFEASSEFFCAAKKKVGDTRRTSLIHAALCREVPESGKLKLYKSNEDEGLGNSVFRHAYSEYEEAPALRLSDWLRNCQISVMSNICLLRMNIEGSEVDVISDLVQSGLATHIDGYFGMWDDMSKIDKKEDERFRAMLEANNIHPFTFNGRDFVSSLRMRAIRYDVATAIRAGAKRLASGRQI